MRSSSFLNTVIFLAAGLLSYGLGFFLIRLSRRLNFLDYPGDRKIHPQPVPFMGGMGVFVSFWLVILAGIVLAFFFDDRIPFLKVHDDLVSGIRFLTPQVLGIFWGSFIILVVGFLDDKFRWPPIQKMLGQFVAIAVLLGPGFRINLAADWQVVGYLITFIWVFLIINAFNFIDSLDGHCAGIALISSLMFFWIVQIIRQPLDGFLLIAFAGALFGFLFHNFKRDKMFLGDNGSLFIGYMMAAFTLLSQYHEPQSTLATTFIPVLIFGVPIYDTVSVVAVRILRGIPPWKGDRNHFAHRLVKIGMSQKVAVIFSYFIAFAIGHIAILTTQVNAFGAVLIGVIFVSILGMIAFLEFYVTREITMKRKRALEAVSKP